VFVSPKKLKTRQEIFVSIFQLFDCKVSLGAEHLRVARGVFNLCFTKKTETQSGKGRKQKDKQTDRERKKSDGNRETPRAARVICD
jgi:hypothetical protein